jgi:hypothetical protein
MLLNPTRWWMIIFVFLHAEEIILEQYITCENGREYSGTVYQLCETCLDVVYC